MKISQPLSLSDYFEAHLSQQRIAHETDRGRQRVLFAVLPALVLAIAHRRGYPARSADLLLTTICAAYAAIGIAYLLRLRFQPSRGVAMQYGFMLLDPLLVVCAVVVDPVLFGWYSVLLLIMAGRVGLRYGLRSLWLQFGACAFWTLLLVGATGISTRDPSIAAVLAVTIASVLPLFLPMVKIQRRAQLLDAHQSLMADSIKSAGERGDFLNQVSHEMRSPLQSILAALELLEVRHPSEIDGALVARARRSSDLLNGQVTDLVTLARSESGSLTLYPRRVDVGSLVLRLIDELRESAEIRQVRLIANVPEAMRSLYIDPIRLSQIVEHVLSYAIENARYGTITTTVMVYDETARKLRLNVETTRCGVSTEDIAAIATAFERVQQSAYQCDGMTIRLAVVATLVGHLGGAVAVRTAPDAGMTFDIELSAIDSAAIEPQAESIVLIVGSRPKQLELLSASFKELGYSADAAFGSSEGFNYLASRSYSLVLCDLDLPKIGGVEFARQVRAAGRRSSKARWIAVLAPDGIQPTDIAPFEHCLPASVGRKTIKRLLAERVPVATLT